MTLSEYALHFIGRPYVWGGDGSGAKDGGFDCSGLAVECLKALGYIHTDMTAQNLFDFCKKNGWQKDKEPVDSDLIFYGRDEKHVTHVAIAYEDDGLMIEAGGGSSVCKNAKSSFGMVRIRPYKRRTDYICSYGI